ncbi:PP2C family protein-serine/threonine phosphatase [Xylanibacter caecicola]|uniref:PP2C family protein-serine/threonine phosphatase n=1 Tax=Xylanibacter caecicola TaxID=2736294 RepID=UPI00258DD965|nr:protein phosphatase 2C domain-containing protein [Xylanibacter caecicola]
MFQIYSQKSKLRGAAESKQGGRKENQDNIGFADTPFGFLLVVCDGMGGGPGGKTASSLVGQYVMRYVMAADMSAPREAVMRNAIAGAEDILKKKVKENPQLAGMGSTLVAILVDKSSALVAHLGDSRCYKIRGNKMLFRTADHSLVSELVENKTMTEEEARTSRQSNVITRALGSTNNHEPQIDIVPYKRGDRFVLCTDGVWGIMSHADLMHHLSSPMDTEKLAGMLSQEIDRIGFSRGGGHDNHTVAVVEMMSDSILQDKMSKQLKTTIAAGAVMLLVSLIINIVCIVKLGSVSDNGEMERLHNENVRLSEYQMKYEALQKLIGQDRKESLDENIRLQATIDSLRGVIDELKMTSMALSTAGRENNKDENVPTLTDGTNVNPVPNVIIINNVIAKLKEAKNVKTKDQSASVKKKEQALTKALELLNNLNKQAGNKYGNDILAISRKLTGKKRVLLLVIADNNKYYVSTTTASHEWEKLIQEAKKLKSKIK